MPNPKVVILVPENIPQEQLRHDEIDTMEEALIIAQSLERLGFSPSILHCSLNLENISKKLRELRPLFCFNLVEHLAGVGCLQHLLPSLLDSLNIPYSGAQPSALLLTTDKVLTKRFLERVGLATPEFFADGAYSSELFVAGKYIVKPITEDASVGIDDAAVVMVNSLEELEKVVSDAEKKIGCRCFVEAFIEGREFNISLLPYGKELEILPPAELVFQNYTEEKPRIVGYAAKWETDSFEYKNVVRTHDFAESDSQLLKKISEMAKACGELLGLKSYFRVDFRARGDDVYIIDVNANPGLGKDTGFVSAAERAGLSFDTVIGRIVTSALPGVGLKRSYEAELR